jgi:hypothetical protein
VRSSSLSWAALLSLLQCFPFPLFIFILPIIIHHRASLHSICIASYFKLRIQFPSVAAALLPPPPHFLSCSLPFSPAWLLLHFLSRQPPIPSGLALALFQFMLTLLHRSLPSSWLGFSLMLHALTPPSVNNSICLVGEVLSWYDSGTHSAAESRAFMTHAKGYSWTHVIFIRVVTPQRSPPLLTTTPIYSSYFFIMTLQRPLCASSHITLRTFCPWLLATSPCHLRPGGTSPEAWPGRPCPNTKVYISQHKSLVSIYQ